MNLAEIVAQMLHPVEREAVLGDLVEAGETGVQAFRSVLGLVVRRQAAWLASSIKEPRLWLGAGLLFPAARLLGRTALNSWLIYNHRHFDPALLAQEGFSIPRAIGEMFCSWALISACVLLATSNRRKASF